MINEWNFVHTILGAGVISLELVYKSKSYNILFTRIALTYNPIP